MPRSDPRIDEYIERSAEFAKPILSHLRSLVHLAHPAIVETMKWSFPHFDLKGNVCSMASFKQHCAFGFWKQSLMENDAFPAEKTAMGSFGRLESLDDLPDDGVMIDLIRQAIKLNENGIKLPPKPRAEVTELAVPEILKSALEVNPLAKSTFENFPYSKRKDYVEWIVDAKSDVTREKRLAATIEQLAEGKSRNWKYEKRQV